MRRVFGPRTVVEAAFLVAVPVVAAAFGARTWTIIAASVVAYLLIVLLEATLGRKGSPAPGLSRLRLPSRNVKVHRPAPAVPEGPATDGVVVVQSAAPAQPPAAPAAEPVAAAAPPPDRAHEHVRVLPRVEEPPALAPEPEPEPAPPPPPAPEPEPEPERVPLAAVPELAPEPTPVPLPEPQTVVPIGVSALPRQWNLFELERLTRQHGGDDVVQDEERQFLLMYLREFADSDGQLPIDFDGLVRDSFGELVGAR
jgi:hypothetical protein